MDEGDLCSQIQIVTNTETGDRSLISLEQCYHRRRCRIYQMAFPQLSVRSLWSLFMWPPVEVCSGSAIHPPSCLHGHCSWCSICCLDPACYVMNWIGACLLSVTLHFGAMAFLRFPCLPHDYFLNFSEPIQLVFH